MLAACSFCLSVALAVGQAPVHAPPEPVPWSGVDLSIVEGLKVPRPDGYTSGLTADFRGGLVRVFVGPSEAAASWWVHRMREVVEKQKPTELPMPSASAHPPGPDGVPPAPRLHHTAEEYWAAGDRLVIVRTGNVGIMVEVASGARDKAEAVAAALLEGSGVELPAPVLRRVGPEWRLETPLTDPPLEVRYEGGQLSGTPGLRFSVPPTAVIVYDRQGRMARQDYDPLGLVIEQPPPWQHHEPVERPAAAAPTSEPQ